MKQLDDMEVFQPVLKSELTQQEVIQSLNSISFIKQKKFGRIKAQACADGRPQRILYNKHDASLPTVKTESFLLTSIIDAAEERYVGIYDIPGAFLHSKLPDIMHVKMTGAMLKCLVAVAPEKYSNFVISENGQDVIYLLLTKALYGCLKSALQFWKHLSKNLIERGYTQNEYDSCVANKEINGYQFTIVRHVDDLKSNHKSSETLDQEITWLESTYGPLVGYKGTNGSHHNTSNHLK